MDIEVRVPATVANLGPGFDCLGAAVGVHLQVRYAPSDGPRVLGPGPPRPPEDALVYRSFVRAHEAAGVPAPGVAVEITQAYASARGMGASASAIVAGLVAGRALSDLDLTDAALARLAIEMEGHGDNVLPAMFGGLVLIAGADWLRFDPDPAISPLILLAAEKFKTKKARAAVPDTVPRADAVANAAATAALVATLCGLQPPEALFDATADRIHEPYRLPLMGAAGELHAALRAEGIPAALAGAGPSLVCLLETASFESARAAIDGMLPPGWESLAPGWEPAGAAVR